MDTFGRTPTEVIQLIDHLVHLPIIDVTNDFKLIIKYPYSTQVIDIIQPTNAYKLLKLIENLKKEKYYCYQCYDYTGYFNIEYNGDIIIVSNNSEIMLTKVCLELFIRALEKYYDLLK